MFGHKKEDNHSLPELPPRKLPELPELTRKNPKQRPEFMQKEQRNALPSFPDSPSHNHFSQAAIKDAISSQEDKEELPELNQEKNFRTMEMEEWSPQPKTFPQEYPSPKQPLKQEIQRIQPPNPQRTQPNQNISLPQQPAQNIVPKQDIFIKIDKFREVRKSLSDISENLEEIDEMLKKIRETKMREEQELVSWEKEISTAKAKIQEVTSAIFEKVQ